jgi:hypothetical protein
MLAQGVSGSTGFGPPGRTLAKLLAQLARADGAAAILIGLRILRALAIGPQRWIWELILWLTVFRINLSR